MALPITHPDYKLTPAMQKALEIVTQPGYERNITKLAQDVGVTRNAVVKWLRPGHPFRKAWEQIPNELVLKRFLLTLAFFLNQRRKPEPTERRVAPLFATTGRLW